MRPEITERVQEYKERRCGKNLKMTDMGLIPVDWDVRKVSDLVNEDILLRPMDGNHGSNHPTSNDYVKSGIPFLLATDVENNKINLKGCKFIKKEQADKLQKGFSIAGDVLLTHKGSVGNVAIVPNIDTDYIMLTPQVTYYRIKNKNKLDNNYLKSYFQSEIFQKYLKIMSKGATRDYIGILEQQKLNVVFPRNINEQRKIGAIIHTWEKAIGLTEKIIEVKKEQKRGLMQALLTGNLRLYGFNGEWKETKLGDVLKERNEINCDGLELLAITARNGIVKRTDVDIKDSSSEDKSKYKRICPLDVGYNTMRMWQGVSGISEYEGIVSPAYTILEPTDQVDSYFIGYLFKLPRVINLFWRHSQGLVDDTLNLKYTNFQKIKVSLPCDVKEQKGIANVLRCIDKEILTHEQKLSLLKQQKNGLMQLLLTGKVRVQI